MIGIDTITVGGTEDRRLVLQNAMIGRKISGSWNTLLVGMRATYEFIATSAYGPGLRLGAMTTPTAAMANGPLSGVAATHFVGMGSAPAIWTRSTTTINHYTNTSSLYLLKSVDGVDTSTTPAASWVRSATDSSRHITLIEIIKGSPNFTLTTCFWNAAAATTDLTKAQMITAMGSANIAAANTYLRGLTANAYSTQTTTVAVDEGTDGTLDSICIAWDRAYPKLYVSDLMFRILA